MRRFPILCLGLLVVLPLAAAQDGLGCFAVAVGRACTADGSVLLAHNEDDGGERVVYCWKFGRARPPAGAVVTLQRGGTVPQIGETCGYLWSQMPGLHYSDIYLNEHGVAIASNACPSREDHPRLTDGGIGFFLRRLLAERARSARHAVDIAVSLLDRFGYAGSGRTLTLADGKEAWLLCTVHGKHYVAARVPDGRAIVVANTYPIHRVDPGDRENFRVSPGLIERARARGWYDPERDGAFDFALAYAAPPARLNRSNHRRQWRGIQLLAVKPEAEGWRQPDFFTPRKNLTPADLMAVLRDHYEGTGYDGTGGYRLGSPHHTRERTICTGSTHSAVVFQLRGDLPPALGALMWIAMRRPDGSVFLPWYLGVRHVPPGFSRGDPSRALAGHFRPEGAAGGRAENYRVFADLCDRLDAAYGKRFPAVKAARDRLEHSFFALQPEVEAVARRLLKDDRNAAIDFLTAYVFGQTARAVRAARQLTRRFARTP